MSSNNNNHNNTATVLPPFLVIPPGLSNTSSTPGIAVLSSLPNVLRNAASIATNAKTPSQSKKNNNNNNNIRNWGVENNVNLMNTTVVPGRVCEEEIGSLVDISNISLCSSAASPSSSSSTSSNIVNSSNNKNVFDQIRASALKSANQSDFITSIKLVTAAAVVSPQNNGNNQNKQDDDDEFDKNMNEMSQAIAETVANRRQFLTNQQQQLLKQQQQQQASATATSSSATTNNVLLIPSFENNNMKNKKSQQNQNRNNNNNNPSSTETAEPTFLLQDASSSAENSLLEILFDSSSSNKNKNSSWDAKTILQVSDLLLRRVESQSFSVGTSLDLSTLAFIIKQAFRQDQQQNENNTSSSLEKECSQLTLFSSILDRLPNMYKCHIELTNLENANNNNNNDNNLTNIMQRILARVFTQEALQTIISCFSALCRCICKSATSTTSASTNNNKTSKQQHQKVAIMNDDIASVNNNQKKQQRTFFHSCYSFSKLLALYQNNNNSSIILSKDYDIPLLLDCCILATTSHAHRDCNLTSSSSLNHNSGDSQKLWKEFVFSPALRLLHSIQIFSYNNNNNNNNSSIAKTYLQALPKMSSSNACANMFSVSFFNNNQSNKSNSSSSATTIQISAVAALALVSSMPLGIIIDSNINNNNNENEESSTATTSLSPRDIIHICHSNAREWAFELVDLLLKASLSPSTSKEEKQTVFAISERFCDDLIQVLSSGLGSLMFPLWDCLVKEFSAILVRNILKNDEIEISLSSNPLDESITNEDAATSTTTTTTKIANVTTADKLRAHVVNILGKLAIAVGNNTSNLTSAAITSSSATMTNNNNNDGVDESAKPLQQNQSQQHLVESSSKWLHGENYTSTWKKFAQGEFEKETESHVHENLLQLDFNSNNNNNSKKNNKNTSKKSAKRTASSSSSDSNNNNNKNNRNKNDGGADAAQKINKKNFAKLSHFAFSDAADNATKIQFIKFHVLSELSKEQDNPFYLSARQYGLARWAYRVEQQEEYLLSSSQQQQQNKNSNISTTKKQHLVPFKSLYSYDPSRLPVLSSSNNNNNHSMNQQQDGANNNNADMTSRLSTSKSSNQTVIINNNNNNISASEFISKTVSLFKNSDVSFSRTQHPDSVLFPKNSDLFMRLILHVFQRNSSSSENNSNKADSSSGGAVVVAGWESARKSALKIISKLLDQNPGLISTAWHLVRRSLHSPSPSVRAAVIPLLVSLLLTEEQQEQEEESEDDEATTGQQNQIDLASKSSQHHSNNNNNNNTNSRNPVGFDDLLLLEESESYSNLQGFQHQHQHQQHVHSAKESRQRQTTSMFTALVLACNDVASQVQTPAVTALCEILESTSSFGTTTSSSSSSSTCSSRKLLQLFQNDSTIERFAISRLIESTIPSSSSSTNTTTATTMTTKDGKLFSRVCKMFSLRWISPLVTSTMMMMMMNTTSSSSHSGNSLYAETHMHGVKEEWCHLASFGLEPPFDETWISSSSSSETNNNNNHNSTTENNNNNNNNSSSSISFRSVSIDDSTDLHLIHPLTLIMKNILASSSGNNQDNTVNAIQRTIRFCLRPWLLDKTEDEDEEDSLLFMNTSSANENNSNNNNTSSASCSSNVDVFPLGKIFAAVRRIGEAAPSRLLSPSCPIFLSILDSACGNNNNNETSTIIPSSNNNNNNNTQAIDQLAVQIVHACDSLRAVVAEPPSTNITSSNLSADAATTAKNNLLLLQSSASSPSSFVVGVAVVDVDRIVGSILTILTKYSGSGYIQKVIAASCRCLSAILTAADRAGNTRQIEKVFRVLNLICSKIAQYSTGMKNQAQLNQAGWTAAAKIITTNILPVLNRYVYLVSSLMRCHQNWSCKDYSKSLKNLDNLPTAQNIIFFMNNNNTNNNNNSSSTATLIPSAIFNVLWVANEAIKVVLEIADEKNNNSAANSSSDEYFVVSQLHRLRGLIIGGFGSLCMLDASTYIRKCENVLKSAMSPSSNNNTNTNNNNNHAAVAVATQAVQAIIDFLIDEEMRIKSANADEKNLQHQQHDSSATSLTSPTTTTSSDSASTTTTTTSMMMMKDQNSGLGPWILQQFWPLIQPLVGCSGSSAALQVAALAFCRVASSQGLASPIAFLPSLVFGASHTTSFSAQDRSASFECIKSIFEHHEDTVAGQFAPAVIRCFDFVEKMHSSFSSPSSGTSGSEQQLYFFKDLSSSFDVGKVYNLIQTKGGKKRRDAFLNVIGKMITSSAHQETWLRSRTTNHQSESKQQQQHEDDANALTATTTPAIESSANHEDNILSHGRSLIYMMMFCARTLLHLPLKDITEIQLLLSILESGFQQNMEVSLSCWSQLQQQQQKQQDDAVTFCRNVSKSVAALLCVELHYSLMNAYGLSKSKIEKWEAKQHQKEQMEVSFENNNNNNNDAAGAMNTSKSKVNINASSFSSMSKLEKAISRVSDHHHHSRGKKSLEAVFDEYLLSTLIQVIEPLFASKKSINTTSKQNSNPSFDGRILRLHQLLEEKNEFMATTVLSNGNLQDSSSMMMMMNANVKKSSSKKKKKITEKNNKKSGPKKIAAGKKSNANKKKSGKKNSSEDDDDEEDDSSEDEDDDDTTSSSSESSSTESSDDDDDDAGVTTKTTRGGRPLPKSLQSNNKNDGRRRARSKTPPPPPPPAAKNSHTNKKK